MTFLEIERAKDLGYTRTHSPYGDLLWRRTDRCMSVVVVHTGETIEEDCDQEPRVILPSLEDMAGNKEWAVEVVKWWRQRD